MKFVIGAVLLGLIITGVTAVAKDMDKEKENKYQNTILSSIDVKDIVLKKVKGEIQSIDPKEEEGRQIDEVKKQQSLIDNDVYIDAYTGNGLQLEMEKIENDTGGVEMNQATISNLITELQAIDIAESVMDGTVTEMELEQDDGQFVYELELITDAGKAEVKVDAMTGHVLWKEAKVMKMLQPSEVKRLPEYQRIAQQIEMDDINVQFITDDPSKRILLFRDASGHEKYKTIYMKSTTELNVIKLNGGAHF